MESNTIIHEFTYRAHFTCKKEKHAKELETCVTWREGIAQVEEQKRKKIEQ